MTPQRDVIAFLSTPGAYGLPDGSPVERIDTHISIVWLAGRHAYKLKRAVTFDYVDFPTVALRRAACEAELHLNQRTAPSLYLGVRPVARDADGGLRLGGDGEPIDWIVEMRRFDQEALLDRLALAHKLDVSVMDGLADAVARLHAMATRHTDRGGRAGMTWVVDGNAHAFAELGEGPERDTANRVTAATRAAVEHHAGLLDARREQGFVRSCHGDLHLRNIFLLDGVPTLFDGVEFNEQISCVDVLYDIAFLIMDLWHRDLRAHASDVFNGYISRTGDLAGVALLPLFLSCRAGVRALTSAAGARVQAPGPRRQELQRATVEYLDLAEALLGPAPPRLVAIGGFSGSGKSTAARALALALGAPPGALVLRSDAIRKELLGVSPLTRLGPEGYTADVTQHVYRTMGLRAKTTILAGQAVIADAVFASPSEREAIATVALETHTPFLGVWLDAPPALMAARLTARRGDVSDATPDVLELQRRSNTPPADWPSIDASLGADAVLRSVDNLVNRRYSSPHRPS